MVKFAYVEITVVCRSYIKFQKWNFSTIIFKKNDWLFATIWNISKMYKIGTIQRNLSTTFLKTLNIYLFSKIFQKVEIVKLRWNILQYFSCNEILVIFLTCFCNILRYVGGNFLMVGLSCETGFVFLTTKLSPLLITIHLSGECIGISLRTL